MTDEVRRGDREYGTTTRLVRIAAEIHRDADALVDVDADVTLSFAQLDDAVTAAAAGFIAAGIEHGDRVAVWAPNIWEWPVAALGAQRAGAVLVPLNTRWKGREAAFALRRSRARALLTVSGFLDTDYVALLGDAVNIRAELPALDHVVVLRGAEAPGSSSWTDFVTAGENLDAATVAARRDEVAPDDVSDILFTSGTTGDPKGVRTTHAQNLRAFSAWADVVGLRAGDRYLVVNPFFHAFGYKAGILASLMTGATLLPHAVFDPEQVLARIPADKISMLPGPPALFQTMLARDDLDHYDLSSLRLCVTGAAPTPVALIEEMWSRLGFETVVTGYGLTEACGIATMCRHDDDAKTIATTSGRAIPGIEVLVVDDDGTELPRGEAGEIVVRGYNVMLDYFEEPEQTASAIDDDGFLHTGDIGVMDERGYVRITDRLKDMYIVGGFNAYPAEIEAMLAQHPAISSAAVVGMPDDRLGEVGAAFVILRDGETAEPDEIVAWAKENMANYKVPRQVEIVDDVPRNAMGKVLKHELRARVRDSRA